MKDILKLHALIQRLEAMGCWLGAQKIRLILEEILDEVPYQD